MMEGQEFGKGEKAYISLEAGDIAKSFLIIVMSFILTGLAALLVKSLLRNNATITILLGTALFVSLFFSMKFAKRHVRKYAERYGWLVIPPALAALFAVSSMKPVVFFVLFLIHSAACVFLRTLKNTARLGIELIMLITVLGSFVYGAKVGALLGAAAMLMDYALTARFSYFVPVTTAAYMLIGILAGSFSSAGITTVGIAATVIYNLATSFIIVAFMGGHLDKCLRFGASNIALNFMLFSTVAPWLLNVMGWKG